VAEPRWRAEPRWKRLLATAMALVVLGVLVTAAATDLQAHGRDRHEHTDLRVARQKLSSSRFDLKATSYARALTTNQLSALVASLTSTKGQLAGASATLSTTNLAAFYQGLNIGTLQTCLGGVQNAYQQIGAHNNAQAATDISAVSAPCLSLAGGANSGLVYPFDFPDPFVLALGGTYFAYATNSVEGNIQIIESSDLTHWSAVGNALPSLPGWAAPNATWAPSVMELGGTFVLYYSAVVAGPGGGEQCISAATATQPQGPFTDSSAFPLECQDTLGGSIDPSPFIDANGTPYLVWKSNGGGPATIWSQQLNPAGTGFAASTAPAPLLSAGGGWEGGVVEAPDLVLGGGRYVLFYSGNNWNSANYAVGAAYCSGPVGPCSRASSQPILSSATNMTGPGGESVFSDSSGSLWMAFHAWVPGAVGYPHSRALYIRPLNLSGATPVVEPAG
jgi:hypothetical protein